MNPSACITGASGFIGSHLVRHLRRAGWLTATVRARPTGGLPSGKRDSTMAGKVVFHCAGIAHRYADLREQMAANRDLTLRLYAQAARSEAVGFVFLSTSKVLGDESDQPLGIDARRRPCGPYAESKAVAEEALVAAGRRFGLPLAIVRPPLVYGPGVKAGFRTLLKAIQLGLPLPLGSATARRSYVSVANLTSALASIGASFERFAESRIWHVADDEDVAAAALCRTLAAHFGQSARLVPVPRSAFDVAARLGGDILAMRINNLFVPSRLDDQALRRHLGWSPPQTQVAALEEAVRWFQAPEGVRYDA